MGGSSGGVIIRQNAKTALKDPMVQAALPAEMKSLISTCIDDDPEDWTPSERGIISIVYAWALCHLN